MVVVVGEGRWWVATVQRWTVVQPAQKRAKGAGTKAGAKADVANQVMGTGRCGRNGGTGQGQRQRQRQRLQRCGAAGAGVRERKGGG